MKFFCEILNGNQPLSAEQAAVFKPLALAVLNLDAALSEIKPNVLMGLSDLAEQRGIDGSDDIGFLMQDLESVRDSLLTLVDSTERADFKPLTVPDCIEAFEAIQALLVPQSTHLHRVVYDILARAKESGYKVTEA